MRFKQVEVASSGKRQYLIALGRVDIELMLGETRNALKHTPDIEGFREVRQRLHGIARGLKEALDEAKRQGDEGDRLPWVERKPKARGAGDVV